MSFLSQGISIISTTYKLILLTAHEGRKQAYCKLLLCRINGAIIVATLFANISNLCVHVCSRLAIICVFEYDNYIIIKTLRQQFPSVPSKTLFATSRTPSHPSMLRGHVTKRLSTSPSVRCAALRTAEFQPKS